MFQLIFYDIFPAEKFVSFQSQWTSIAPSKNQFFSSKIFHTIFSEAKKISYQRLSSIFEVVFHIEEGV